MTTPSLTEIIEKLKSEKPEVYTLHLLDGYFIKGCGITNRNMQAVEAIAEPTREELLTALQVLSEALENIYPPEHLTVVGPRIQPETYQTVRTHDGYLHNIYWKDLDSIATEALTKAHSILTKKAGE